MQSPDRTFHNFRALIYVEGQFWIPSSPSPNFESSEFWKSKTSNFALRYKSIIPHLKSFLVLVLFLWILNGAFHLIQLPQPNYPTVKLSRRNYQIRPSTFENYIKPSKSAQGWKISRAENEVGFCRQCWIMHSLPTGLPSFKNSRKTFLKYTKFVNILILRLQNCKKKGQALFYFIFFRSQPDQKTFQYFRASWNVHEIFI